MKRRVIFLTHEFFPFRGGVATYVQELADAMHRIGADVEVWTNGSPLSGSDFNAPYPIRYVGGQAGLRWFSRLMFALYLFKQREDLDKAIPVYSSYGALFCGMLLSGLGFTTPSKFGVILHGSEILKLERAVLLKWCCCRFFSRAAFLATTSQHIMDRLGRSCLGLHPTCRVVLTCAPPYGLVRESRLHHHREDTIHVLTLARIHRRKGHIETARALGKLPAELRKRVVWKIAGTGDQNYLSQVIRVCREQVVRYHLVGEVSDELLPEVYGDSDIYVMSSRSLPRSIEGFGITYLEAGLFGIPVVGYQTGGVAEAVVHEKTGLLVPEGDIDALSTALAALIRDRDLRVRMGLAGREYAMGFDWENSARALCRVAGQEVDQQLESTSQPT